MRSTRNTLNKISGKAVLGVKKRLMERIRIVFIITFCFCIVLSLNAQQVAFPGAEGFGAYTTGGRSGTVYEVTNLNDSGSGSLRDAVSGSNRTIVFRVSGYINLQSALKINGNSITIAGQTAPGDGICVRDYPAIVEGDNMIIRYMRFRLGDKYNLTSSDAIDINDQKNVIIDHCSISWGVDECASWYGNEDVTIQWSIIGEGLNYNMHSMGGLWGGQSTYHHNLIHSCGSRHPKFAYTYDEDITDHRNNVIYNWDYESAYCSPTGRVNIVANYYKYGPSTNSSVKHRIVYSEYDTKRLYIADNYVFGYPDVTADNWNGGVDGVPIRHNEPFPAPAIAYQTAEESYESVLEHVGASLQRDSVDLRVINNVLNGTGSILSRQSDVGGFPVLQSLIPPIDTDHDGMPDDWEDENQLNKNNDNDRNDDHDNDGFTNLEEYLNSLIPVEYSELPQDTFPPAAPSNLTATTFSGNQIDLTWIDNAVNERGFLVQYSDDEWETFEELTSALANLRTFSVKELNGSTRYQFRVAAYNTAGYSDYSNITSDSTIADNHFFLHTSVEGPGRIELDPAGGIYAGETVVKVTAIPDSGYVFDSWISYLTGVNNPEYITINTSIHVTAKFTLKSIEVPLDYDFGPGSLEPGYTQITKSNAAYTVGRGYGFSSTSGLDERDRGAPDALREDFIVAESPQTFIVDLPNDEYYINVIAGDNMSNAPNGPMDVYAEDILKIQGMFSDGGAFDEQDFTVEISDNQLNLYIRHSEKNDGVWRINVLEITPSSMAVKSTGNLPVSEFHLEQNYPNPFNPTTTISYSIANDSHVRIVVFDMLGREVGILVDEEKKSGSYTVLFDARDLASGIYFYALQAGDLTLIKKSVLLK
jgi:hypothetical protein